LNFFNTNMSETNHSPHQRSELAFSPELTAEATAYVDTLFLANQAGQAADFAISQTSRTMDRYASVPEETRGLLLVEVSAAAGVAGLHPFVGSVESLLENPVDATAVLETAHLIGNVKNNPHSPPEQIAESLHATIDYNLTVLGKREAQGEDVSALRLAMLSLGMGATLANPQLANNYRSNLMTLMQTMKVPD
jgi:hypothetical protein